MSLQFQVMFSPCQGSFLLLLPQCLLQNIYNKTFIDLQLTHGTAKAWSQSNLLNKHTSQILKKRFVVSRVQEAGDVWRRASLEEAPLERMSERVKGHYARRTS